VPDYKNNPNDWRSEEPKKPEITDFYESKAEKYIVEAHRAGVSRRKMFEELGWPVGGRSNEKINNILYKYGVGTDS